MMERLIISKDAERGRIMIRVSIRWCKKEVGSGEPSMSSMDSVTGAGYR